jgi:hypothetical protein
MPLHPHAQLCDPPSPSNADGWSLSPNIAVLLDGAASRSEERVSSYANDTVWLVQRFLELFAAGDTPAPGADIPDRIERARLALKSEYDALCTRARFTPDDAPFACLAVAHHAGGRLDLFNMGDLTALLRMRDGSLVRFGESAVRELDGKVLAAMERDYAAGVAPHAERLARAWPMLRAHRALRNQLPGYEVLDVNVSCLGRLDRWSGDAAEVSDVLLMSDGFYRLVDTLARYDDAGLIEAVEQRGLQALMDELRSVERADPECTRHLRFKCHDDATALWLGVD